MHINFRRLRTSVCVGLILLGSLSPLAAQKRPHGFVGAKILPMEGDTLERGTVVVHGGKILAIGPSDSTPVPPNAVTIDARGKWILPGLVCTHSHIGRSGRDRSGPLQPDIRIADGIDIRDPGFRRAVAGGLTCLNIMPGSGRLIGGQTIYVKLRQPRTVEDLFIRDPSGRALGGLKMANGTNPQGDPPYPGSRAKSAALVRQKFLEAQEYGAAVARAGDDASKRPPRNLGLEALLEVLAGTRIVHHHTHRHDDVVTVLRLAKEFGFRVVLHHVSEGWKVVKEIAAAKVPCSLIIVDSPGGKLEAVDLLFKTGGVLDKAGVDVAFHTDDPITDSRLFLRSAGLAVRAGMSRDAALRALTIAGARMIGLEDRVGSLKVGKDADLVLLDGDPLSVYTKVQETWVEGVKVFDRSNPKDLLYAVGGIGAGHNGDAHICCHPAEGDHR